MNILDNPNIKKIHCMGIGGIGVSGVAEILLARGYQLSGSDVAENRLTEYLRGLGVKISIGHASDNIKDVDAVVYSSAISPENSEFAAAKKANLPIISRGEMLAQLMLPAENRIAIAGTHGKTTTTALVSHLLLENHNDPTYLIGGILNNQQSPAHQGSNEYFVAESDESDASFLYLDPNVALITNIDADHLSTYENNFEYLKTAFLKFLKKLPSDRGVAILNIDDANIAALIPQLNCRVMTYGFSENADICAQQFSQQQLVGKFMVKRRGQQNLAVALNLPGKHNALNALAVIALAQVLKIKDETLLNALKTFPGVGRRFYAHGTLPVANGGGALLFDDYGHHPNEIKATIMAAKQAWPERRLVMVFQPHRYTRTHDLMAEFAEVLCAADFLLLLNVYSAGESEIAGADSRALLEKITSKCKVESILVPSLEELPFILKQTLRSNDVVLFQGAGSIGPFANTISQHEIFKS